MMSVVENTIKKQAYKRATSCLDIRVFETI